MGLGWYEGQGLAIGDNAGATETGGGLPWLRMVQTLARDIHTPQNNNTNSNRGGGSVSSSLGEDVDGGISGSSGSGGGSAYEAVAARLAGAMVLTMQDSLVWSLTLPAIDTDTDRDSATVPLSIASSSTTNHPSRIESEVKEEGEVEGGDILLKEGDLVPVIYQAGSELMVLSAKVLSIETSNNNNVNNSADSYTMQFLCDHSIERVSQLQNNAPPTTD